MKAGLRSLERPSQNWTRRWCRARHVQMSWQQWLADGREYPRQRKKSAAPCRRAEAGIVSARRRRLFLPWLVAVPLIIEMIRPSALYLRHSEAYQFCQDQVVPRVRVASRVWSIHCSKVIVHDESLLLDNPEYKFLEPMLMKLQSRLSTSVISIRRQCNLRFEGFGPPVLYQLRHHRFSRRAWSHSVSCPASFRCSGRATELPTHMSSPFNSAPA